MSPPNGGNGLVRFGVFDLDLRRHELRRQGRRVRLQDKPFELLVHLLSRPGVLVTRDELRHRLWPDDTFVVFDDSLNTAVRKAREALGDSATVPRFIETVPRHGYRFIAPVERVAEPADAGSPAPPPSTEARTRSVLVTAAALLAVLLGLGWSYMWSIRSGPSPSAPGAGDLIRYRLSVPAGHHISPGGPHLAVSPDGRHVAFVAHVEPAVGRKVWIQSLDAAMPRALPGTEEAFDVFWSPDGRVIAFIAVGMLRTLPLDGGTAVALGRADGSSGGAWSAESGLLVADAAGAGLVLFPPGGGAARTITTLDTDRGERAHRFPQFLPDGRTYLYLAESHRREQSAIFVARIGEPGRTRLIDTPYKAELVAPDTLLFVGNGRLMSQRVDLGRLTLRGAPHEVLSGVHTTQSGEAWFSSSSGGALAYAGPPPPEPRGLAWLGADGRRLGTLPVPATCTSMMLSPDDRRVAAGCRETPYGPPDIWVVETDSGKPVRLTTHPANDGGPVWSPDGKTMVYARARAIRVEADIYALDPASPEATRPLLAADGASEHPTSWSPDGALLLFEQEGNAGKEDLWVWPIRTGGAARPWLATSHSEHRGVISPDGRSVVYESDRTGRPEVYVRALAAPDAGEWPLSTRGGRGPRWQRGGRAVYFVSEDWQMTMAEPGPSGTWRDVVTRVLFELPGRSQPPGMPPAFDVTRDGQRFLVGPAPMAGGDPPMTVVLGWQPR